ATCDAQGNPSNRMVLIKSITEKGLKFHTNEQSQKGQDIAQNPKGSMCFYWKSTRKQIRLTGAIEMVCADEADEYFATRSVERQTGAWASKQSQPFERREELERAIEKYEQKFAGVDNIPRPPYWQGYRLTPTRIEFWIAQKDRLHTRFVYKQDGEKWRANWLCP
ncbi:MAG: pyridoxamine 5'-phosphate oxidase, partial [Alphaproteobacteria bacterium]